MKKILIKLQHPSEQRPPQRSHTDNGGVDAAGASAGAENYILVESSSDKNGGKEEGVAETMPTTRKLAELDSYLRSRANNERLEMEDLERRYRDILEEHREYRESHVREIERLRDELEDLRRGRDRDMERIQADLQETTNKMREIEMERNALAARLHESSKMDTSGAEQLERMRHDIDAKNQELLFLRGDCDAMRANIDDLLQRERSYQEDLRGASEKIAKYEVRLDELENEKRDLTESHRNSVSSLRAAVISAEELDQQIRSDIEDLRWRIKAMTTDIQRSPSSTRFLREEDMGLLEATINDQNALIREINRLNLDRKILLEHIIGDMDLREDFRVIKDMILQLPKGLVAPQQYFKDEDVKMLTQLLSEALDDEKQTLTTLSHFKIESYVKARDDAHEVFRLREQLRDRERVNRELNNMLIAEDRRLWRICDENRMKDAEMMKKSRLQRDLEIKEDKAEQLMEQMRRKEQRHQSYIRYLEAKIKSEEEEKTRLQDKLRHTPEAQALPRHKLRRHSRRTERQRSLEIKKVSNKVDVESIGYYTENEYKSGGGFTKIIEKSRTRSM